MWTGPHLVRAGGDSKKDDLNGSEQKEPLRGKQSGKQTGERSIGVPWGGVIYQLDGAADHEESGAEMGRQRGPHQQRRGAGAPLDRLQCSPKVTRPLKLPCPWEATSPFLKPQTHELHFGPGKSSVQHRMGRKGRHFITAIVITIRSNRSLMSTHTVSFRRVSNSAGTSTTVFSRRER